MPIDLAAVAAVFTASLTLQCTGVQTADRKIAPVLDRRRRAVRMVEQASRQFPILRFHNGAVSVRLASDQRRMLAHAPVVSLPLGSARGGLDLIDNIERAVAPLSAETSSALVIPRTLVTVEGVLADIEASVRGYAHPVPGAFDPAHRRAVDLFGLAGLAFRSLAQASRKDGEIDVLAARVRTALAVLGVPSGPGTPTANVAPSTTGHGAAMPPGSAQPAAGIGPGTSDAAETAVLAGVVILAAVPRVVTVLGEAATRFAAFTVLGYAEAIEHMVLSVRRTALETVFASIGVMARKASALASAVYGIIGVHVSFHLRLATVLGSGVASSVKDFLARLTACLAAWVHLLRVVTELIEAITPDARTLPLPVGDPLSHYAEAPALRFESRFPNLGEALFGDGRGRRLTEAVDRAEGALRDGLSRAPGDTGHGLDRLAASFTAEGERASRIAVGDRLAQAARQAGRLSDVVAGDEVARQREAVDRVPEDTLGKAFNTWLATGGFVLMGEALSLYVRELTAFWRTRADENATAGRPPAPPTSPHILHRRARLSRVRVPRLTLRVPPGRALDGDLADVLSGHFADAVHGAYREGLGRLAGRGGEGSG